MCGDSNRGPAPYRGGAMASIKGATDASYILRFSNPESQNTTTRVTCEALNDDEKGMLAYEMDGAQVYIHKFGYLPGHDALVSKNPVLHSLTVGNNLSISDETAGSFCERVGLDVSENGVIGRGVSVVKEGKNIGFGIIGWQ